MSLPTVKRTNFCGRRATTIDRISTLAMLKGDFSLGHAIANSRRNTPQDQSRRFSYAATRAILWPKLAAASPLGKFAVRHSKDVRFPHNQPSCFSICMASMVQPLALSRRRDSRRRILKLPYWAE